MSARRLPEPDDGIYTVKQWKETLDPGAPWWQRWYHRFVYRPFNEFSLRVMKVPPDNHITIDGNKVSFSLVEDGGFFASEHEADLACLSERDSYQQYTFGRLYPRGSGQHIGPVIFPRAKNPRKRADPVLRMLIKPCKVEEQMRQELAKISKTLDQ